MARFDRSDVTSDQRTLGLYSIARELSVLHPTQALPLTWPRVPVVVTHALKLGIGTQTGLTYTFGATQGPHASVSVFCSTCRPASMWAPLDLFWAHPGVLGAEQLASALVAAELAQMPLLDLLAEDLPAAVADPDSDSWAELDTLSRAEVSQATGMLVAQLEVGRAGRGLGAVVGARLCHRPQRHRRRLRHPGSPTTPAGRVMRAHLNVRLCRWCI